jgi:hypothetical protein
MSRKVALLMEVTLMGNSCRVTPSKPDTKMGGSAVMVISVGFCWAQADEVAVIQSATALCTRGTPKNLDLRFILLTLLDL